MKRKYLILAILAPLLILFDQATKIWATYLPIDRLIPVIEPFFSWRLAHNKGVAISLFAESSPVVRLIFVYLLPLGALGVVFVMLKKLPDKNRLTAIGLACVVGGAVGNLIDRIRLGYVVDFIHIHWKNTWHYPTFNIADIAIGAGVILLMLEMFKKPE